MDYTINLTDSEDLALKFAAVDPQEWIDNAVKNRARIAIDEICSIYTNAKLNNNQPITVTNKSDMVVAAFEEGIIKTAAESLVERMNQPPSV